MKPLIYIQDQGTYSNETIVAVGYNIKEIAAFAKKHKLKAAAIDWLESFDKDFKPSESGYCLMKNGWTVLWLRPFEDVWVYWETLIHELVHLIDYTLGEQKKMHDETEAKAYQMEYLFRSIRRRIQDHYEPSKKKRKGVK